jgi:hypothetical protein
MSASRVSARLASRIIKQEPDDTPTKQTPKKKSAHSKQSEIASITPLQILSEDSIDEAEESAEEEPVATPLSKMKKGGRQVKPINKGPVDELTSARSKLSDILTGIALGNEHHDGESDEDVENTDRSLSPPTKVRRLKGPRKSRKADDNLVKPSFILTLFDRPVDLAPFCVGATTEDLPLYPICREWIRGDRPEDEFAQLRACDETESDKAPGNIHRLPNPLPQTEAEKNRDTRIPQNLVKPVINTDDLDNAINSFECEDMTNLLTDNLNKWKNIRQDWAIASMQNEQRYKHSCDVLKSMYEKSMSSQGIIEPKQEPLDVL